MDSRLGMAIDFYCSIGVVTINRYNEAALKVNKDEVIKDRQIRERRPRVGWQDSYDFFGHRHNTRRALSDCTGQ